MSAYVFRFTPWDLPVRDRNKLYKDQIDSANRSICANSLENANQFMIENYTKTQNVMGVTYQLSFDNCHHEMIEGNKKLYCYRVYRKFIKNENTYN